MSLPESMSRIVIVGTKSHMDEAIDALFSVGAVHLIDHTVDADEGFTLGTSRPYAAKASERLLKVRAMEKDLGITKRTPTAPISESEIKSKISSNSVELVEDEVISVLDKKNDLNQRITELNATKKSLEQLSKLDIDLDLYSGYKSIFSMVGTVTSDPSAALADIPCEIYSSGISKKEGGVVAVFAKLADRDKVQAALSDCDFSEISVPDESGKPSAALAKTEHELQATQAEYAKVEEELNSLLEKHKDFLKASEEELSIEAAKGEIPVRIATSDYSFVMDGWVPTKKVEAIKIDIEAKVEGAYVEIEETRGRSMKEVEEAEDRFKEVPTKFNNGRVVKEFQYRLTQNTYDTRRWQLGERPGEYKKHDYVTGKDEIGASPEDAQAEVSELLEELNGIPKEKALTAAAYFHAKFENIHPFADGNGRTGRLAMNYLLLLNGHPPVIIHEEDRAGYYAALEAWDERQELEPMLRYLQEQTAKTWEKQLARAERRRGNQER